MGRAEQRNKNQKMAEFLRKNGVVRNTGQCPSCHGGITNGRVHLDTDCVRVKAARKESKAHKHNKRPSKITGIFSGLTGKRKSKTSK